MIPKFRVWNKMNRRMYSVIDSIGLSNGQPSTVRIWADDILMTFLIGEEVELMQSTGLKNKNDVEIFGGDILESNFQTINGGFSKLRYSVFQDQAGAWRVKNPNGTLSNVLDIRMASEVIGNIYENPELLEDSE